MKRIDDLTPEQIAGTSEASQQSAIFCWAALPEVRAQYPQLKWLFAVPNGGQRDKITGGRLKAQGVKAGVPDLMLPVVCGGYHGLWIELKKDWKSKPTKEQIEWLNYLQSAGYCANVCNGWIEAKKCIIWYLNGAK